MTLLRTTRGGKPVEFALANGGVLLGTAPGCQIVVADPAAAPKHCKIAKSPQGFVVTDLSGGTIVNGAKVKEHVLKPGDVLQIGSEKFTFAEKQEPVAAAAVKAPASAVRSEGGAPTPPAGGRRPLPSRPAGSGARAPTARKMTPKPGAVARVQKSQSTFVLPSTKKGKAIALAVGIGIVVLGGILFVISSGTKNSEEVKKQALEEMKQLEAIPENEYEKRLEKIDAIITNPDYVKYALAEIDPARRMREPVAAKVKLQKDANGIVKPWIEKYKTLKNGPIEDFKPKWNDLYDELRAHLESYGTTTFGPELTAIRNELKELIENIGPSWNEELPKFRNEITRLINAKNYNQGLVEVENFQKKFKDVSSSQFTSQVQDVLRQLRNAAKDRVEELKKLAAEKSTKEEKRRIFEAARPFLQGFPEALKELDKAISESTK
jgi:hypothetical protein